MGSARIASFRQLKTFRTVARVGSMSLAADELHLSQSAVSIQIGELEASFGTALVMRTGRGVRLTEAGEMLDRYAARMLALWAETTDDMSSFLGEFSGILRVGAVTTAEFWLPQILVTFAGENPKVKVRLHIGKRDEIVRSLANHEIDIAVMGQPPPELNVVAASFAKNPVAFVAAPNHPLTAHPNLTIAILSETRLLVREPGSGTRATVERLFKDAGLRLRIGSELAGNESLKQMCVAGFGPAYLSLHTCVSELNTGTLVILPLPNNPFERDWFHVRLSANQVPALALAFEKFLGQKGQSEIRAQMRAARGSGSRTSPPSASPPPPLPRTLGGAALSS